MLKRLLLPGFAVSALALSATPSGAASFILDNFNQPTTATCSATGTNNNPAGQQCLYVGRLIPGTTPGTNTRTVTNLANVLGGSRRLDLNLQFSPSRSLFASSRVNGTQGIFDIANDTGVTSRTTLRYDNNGAGLGAIDGNWLSGPRSVDFFGIKIVSIDTNFSINFTIEDTFGRIAQITRTISRQTNGSILINNPSGLPSGLFASNTAVFSLSEFLLNNPNINLSSIKYAQFNMTGAAGFDARIDYIQGVEIPEPSLVIGSLIAVGLGGFLSKNK